MNHLISKFSRLSPIINLSKYIPYCLKISHSNIQPLHTSSNRLSTNNSIIKPKTATMDGNEACANAAYALSECAFIYPITPATPMSEYFDLWSTSGRKSIIGDMPIKVHEMQSEGGAVGALHGATVSGSLVTTFTSSQGLLLMIPNLWELSGELLPCVFHVAARSLTKQVGSMYCDHNDVMSCRSTGIAMLCSNNPQETQDLAIISHISTIKSRLPFMHFFDGFRTSHAEQKITLFTDSQIKQLYPYKELETNLRNIGMNIDNPNQRGTASGPESYFHHMVANHKYFIAAPHIIQNVMNDFATVTGRKYKLFDYYGSPNAERCIIMMGSGCGTVEQTIDEMNKRGENVGLIKVHLFRPWSDEYLLSQLPESIKRICVLDRTREDGARAQPLHLDIQMSISNSDRNNNIENIIGGIYGLSGREFTPAMVRAIYNELNKPIKDMKREFVIGINDDVNHTSLDYKQFENGIYKSLPMNTTQCMFWGMGSDGTVGANKQAIKDIASNTDLYVQSHFLYDAHKSGGVTVSHLRFGPQPIKAEYEIQQADYISVHNPQWIKQFDTIVKKAKDNSILVINSAWDSVEKYEMNIPKHILKMIGMKNIKLYNINATEVANSVGLGKHINSVMQSVFYKLSGVLPEEEAMNILKNSIYKMYNDKSQKIIDMNISAIDKSLEHLIQIKYPINKWCNISILNGDNIIEHDKILHRKHNKNTPEYVEKILYPIADMNASDLPVSIFEPGGIIPKQTSKYEKRAISSQIPYWNADKCTQCNNCSLVCPHAVIRPFLLNKEELQSAPQGYISKPSNPKINGYNFSLQFSPMDCTGCEVCVASCPQQGLSMISYEENVEKQSQIWDYSINNVTNKAEAMISSQDRLTLKGSQFYEPLLEFSGACAGCSETPYLKLMTQMFGKNSVIANATGCSMIWGGHTPCNPYGIPWANSLFEDNAEFGYGIFQGANQRRQKIYDKLNENFDEYCVKYGQDISDAIYLWLHTFNDIPKNNIASDNLYELLNNANILNEILGTDSKMLKKQITWIVGGDGWAYDIGYGGLDHIMAQNENVNILVLDNEMYSNTGGQASKATPAGASVKFAEGGMSRNKKDLGQMAMMYKNVYVASIAMGANYQQTINAFKEAVEYNGTSLILALAPCMGWGIDMKYVMENQKIAVDTGHWPLYRYDPRKLNENKNAFQLDSKRIKKDLKEWLGVQNRFTKLERSEPVIAKELQNKLKMFNENRHENLIKTALDDNDYYEYLCQKLHGQINASKTVILYGSETGNAKNLADNILYELKRRNISNISIMSMDDYDIENLIHCNNEINIIFTISTCGQGDLPNNCQYFMKELIEFKEKGEKLSNKMHYAIFGLGDSSYVYFNKSAQILDEILNDMGGNKLIELGLGNDKDENGYDTVFEEWSPSLFTQLNCDNPSFGLMESNIYTNMYEMNRRKQPIYKPLNCVHIALISNTKMCVEEYDRDFRHYIFDNNENKLSFDVGDCLGILPINDIKQIENILNLYNINNANNVIEINNNEIINIFDLFSKKLDILGKPKRRFYELLSMIVTNENEKQYLNYILSIEGNEEFKQFQLNETPNYIDLLTKYFSSCKPSINYLIEYIPELKQRLYSIANSANMYPTQIDLFTLKNDWYTATDNIYKEGICTKYLETLSPQNNDKIYGKIHKASITIPSTYKPPLILTSTGTGIAPLRAHIQDRVYAKSIGENIGPIALIFGSRNKKYEYFYKDELEEYHSNGKGVLTHLFATFSRDLNTKYYITDRIEEEGELITDYLINKCGYFYYCGKGDNVPNNIEKSIIKSFMKYGNLNENEAKQKIIDMKLSGHYNIEAW